MSEQRAAGAEQVHGENTPARRAGFSMRESLWLSVRSTSVIRALRKHPLPLRLLRRVSHWLLPPTRRRLYTVRSGPMAGLKMELNPRWDWEIWQGTAEADIQELVKSELCAGSVFYDVGAGIGLFSLLAARQGATVFAFEPHPANVRILERHTLLNGLQDFIHPQPLAAHSECGRLSMCLSTPRDGDPMALLRQPDSESESAIEISCTTLDEFAKSNPPPSLVKVDVEGAESNVLKGAGGVFDKARPRLICEIHSAENERFVVDWLTGKNYTLRWFDLPGRRERHLFAEPKRARE